MPSWKAPRGLFFIIFHRKSALTYWNFCETRFVSLSKTFFNSFSSPCELSSVISLTGGILFRKRTVFDTFLNILYFFVLSNKCASQPERCENLLFSLHRSRGLENGEELTKISYHSRRLFLVNKKQRILTYWETQPSTIGKFIRNLSCIFWSQDYLV